MRLLAVDLIDEPLYVLFVGLEQQRLTESLELSVVETHSFLPDLLEDAAEEVEC